MGLLPIDEWESIFQTGDRHIEGRFTLRCGVIGFFDCCEKCEKAFFFFRRDMLCSWYVWLVDKLPVLSLNKYSFCS